MRGLFPGIQPNMTRFIEAGDGQRLYLEESGNPQGIPVVYCHGGPGGASAPLHRCFYDPEVYRIILFDQRGCGQSTPHAAFEHNTTFDLVRDMELIRETLGIDRWVVSGGSWGSTLALVYAVNHPDKVMGLILRGIFLAREEDYHWLYAKEGGAAQVFPDYYRDFVELIHDAPSGGEMQAYYRLLTSNNEIERLHAAKCWATWEGKIATLKVNSDVHIRRSEIHSALSLARLECHYFVNDCFLPPNYLADNLHMMADIPGFIIHGRYDMVCKLENAFTLDKYWTNGKLQVIPAAGHSCIEPPMADALCRASDAMADFLAKQDKDQ